MAERRLARYGRDIRQADGVIISHDHGDHISSAGVFHRKFGLPVYITEPTLTVGSRRRDLGKISDIRHFSSGDTLEFGGVKVETVPTAHDGADGVGFVIEDNGTRLGVLTDLGHVFEGLAGVVATLDAVFLESNYDPDMLAHGPYPKRLKKRIRGARGHLSNCEAAELIASAGQRLAWACLAHLSEQNNTPSLALETHRQILGESLPLHVASRYQAGEPLAVNPR